MRIHAALVVCTCLLLSACSPTLKLQPGELPPATLPSSEQHASAESFIAKENQQHNYTEVKACADTARTKKVVERLTLAAGFPSQSFPVHVVDAGELVNAEAVDGASIVVYKKLLSQVHGDDELAVVLGHEMGHILARHYENAKTMKARASAVSIGSSILGAVASVATSYAGLGGIADMSESITRGATRSLGYGAFVGSFSRAQEYDADKIGLVLMAKAGYDPSVAPQFWHRSKEVFGGRAGKLGGFFSTHPVAADREQALKEQLEVANKLYAECKMSPKVKTIRASLLAAKKGA